MRNLMVSVCIIVLLAGCHHVRIGGSASEHGLKNIEIGVPF